MRFPLKERGMRNTLSADDLFSEVLLLRTADNRAIVLAEGPSDVRALAPHVDWESAQLIPTQGAINLDGTIKLVNEKQVPGVVGIRDRDWLGAIGPLPDTPNIVYTDLHDLDATIFIGTPAGERIILTHGDPGAVRSHCKLTNSASGIDIVTAIAADLGALRRTSERHGLGLSLKNFPIHEVLDADGLVIIQRMISIALKRSSVGILRESQVAALFTAERLSGRAEDLCCGHDIGAIVSTLCASIWQGSKSKAESILQAARAALSCAELQTLNLYIQLHNWEMRTNFNVWRCQAA